MRPFLWLLVLAWSSLASGCAGRLLPPRAEPHGNVLAITGQASARALRKQQRRRADPLVVLIERHGLRAIDPVTAEVRWHRDLRITGAPAATHRTIFVPVSGHRLHALDRQNGVTRWEVPLPGEALTGLDASESTVAATVIDPRAGRSRLVGLSTVNGQLRWTRRSSERLGAPASVGTVVLVSIADQVVALRSTTGWERARIDLPGRHASRDGAPAFEHVSLQRSSLIAGEGTRFVDLSAASGGRVESGFGVEAYAPTLQPIDGLHPGMTDAERLRLWVSFMENGDAPRSAVLLCRRAVVSLRLSPAGQPTQASWVYRSDDREFVAMDVGARKVTLVAEDGGVLVLDRGTGRELDRIAGGDPVRGALLLDVDRSDRGRLHSVEPARIAADLVALLRDPDPRLVPAQRLAADLLWRAPDPRTREVVDSLAHGEFRPGGSDADAALRSHALDLLSEPWGRPEPDAVREILAGLQTEPSYLDDRRPAVGVLARRAVKAGSAQIVPSLVEHLLHPMTPPAELAELVDALAQLGRADAVDGVATFLRRYHADPEVVYESNAMQRAVDLLAAVARDDGADAEVARKAAQTLLEVWNDPFTEPTLRAYMQPRLAALKESRREGEPLDEHQRLSAVSNSGL